MAALPEARDPGGSQAASGLVPAEALRRLARLPRPACFHDGRSGWILVTADPTETLRVASPGDPFALLQDLFPSRGDGRHGPPADPGWLGLLTYESGRAVERIPARIPESTATPRLHLARYPAGWWWHPSHGGHLAGDPIQARRLGDALETPCSGAETADFEGRGEGAPAPDLDRDGYRRAFARIAEAIAAGDVYQVNLTTTLRGRWRGHPLAFHEALVGASPPPFAAYLDLGDAVIASASPELLLAHDAATGQVVSAPIKGTAPRGDGASADARLARALMASEKDRAEHVMIVDLVRNDLGRVCRPGSVRARSLMAPLPLPGLRHLVTEVEGRLDAGRSIADLLRAVFPGGSITGAPKVAAMGLIDALEVAPRGVYCGALGRISPSGDLCLALPIRTATLTRDAAGPGARRWSVAYGAGGGLVADSRPDAEHAELLLKARRLCEVLGG
jgi:para-aminobenzoate synthetase component I